MSRLRVSLPSSHLTCGSTFDFLFWHVVGATAHRRLARWIAVLPVATMIWGGEQRIFFPSAALVTAVTNLMMEMTVAVFPAVTELMNLADLTAVTLAVRTNMMTKTRMMTKTLGVRAWTEMVAARAQTCLMGWAPWRWSRRH